MSVEQNTNINVNQMRCNECNKKINITNSLTCKCDKLLCYKHRYQTDHKCTFDYKIHDRNILTKCLESLVEWTSGNVKL